MAQAVQFNRFGGPEVLEVVDIDAPRPGPGEVLVEVVASGVNPVESARRRGEHPDRSPASFPAGEGRDLAGIVAAVGPGVTRFQPNDSVMGWAEGAHATFVVAPESQLMRKPAHVTWEVAGSLYVAGTTAWGTLRQTGVGEGDTVVITAAAGGLGCIAAQLAVLRGATVFGTSVPERFDFLRQLGVHPLAYGPDLAGRVRAEAPDGVDAFIDFLGTGDVAAAAELGVPTQRITTLTDWDAVDEQGVGRAAAGDMITLERVAKLVEDRQIRLPVADIFPLEQVQDAYRAMEKREAPGKIVIGMQLVEYPGQKVRGPALKEQESTLDVPTVHEHLDVQENLPPVVASPRAHADRGAGAGGGGGRSAAR